MNLSTNKIWALSCLKRTHRKCKAKESCEQKLVSQHFKTEWGTNLQPFSTLILKTKGSFSLIIIIPVTQLFPVLVRIHDWDLQIHSSYSLQRSSSKKIAHRIVRKSEQIDCNETLEVIPKTTKQIWATKGGATSAMMWNLKCLEAPFHVN